MKRFIHKIGLLMLTLLVAFGGPVSAHARGGGGVRELLDLTADENWPDVPEVNAEGAFLIELNSGQVLYAKNADQQFYPASITKIMTGLLVAENCNLEDMVTFSYDAVHDIDTGGFSYIADTGDQLSVQDCLYAMMLASSNEAAYALAEHAAGTMDAFAEKMTERARAIGATNTHFANAHGLYHEDHYTTPHDMALIMWEAIMNDVFYTCDTTLTYNTAATRTQVNGYSCQMRHQMMQPGTDYYNSSVKAGKTGYIQAAGNTLVTYAVKNDMELICVIMKADGSDTACQETQKLLDYGFNSFTFRNISQSADLSQMEKQASQALGRVIRNFEIDAAARALVPAGAGDITWDREFVIEEDSAADDQAMGKIIYTYKGVVMGEDPVKILLVPEEAKTPETPAETAAEQEPAQDGTIAELLKENLLMVIFIGLLLLLAIVILTVIIQHNRRKKRRRKRSRASGK